MPSWTAAGPASGSRDPQTLGSGTFRSTELEDSRREHRQVHHGSATSTGHEPLHVVESIYQQPMIKLNRPNDPSGTFRFQPAPPRRETVMFDRDPAMVLFDRYRGCGMGNNSHCNNYSGYQVQWVIEQADDLQVPGAPLDPGRHAMPPQIPNPLLPKPEIPRPETPPQEPPPPLPISIDAGPPPRPRRRVKKKKKAPIAETTPDVFGEPEPAPPKPFKPSARATDVVVVINRRLEEQVSRASTVRARYSAGLGASVPAAGS